jgi:glucoamylase
MNPLSTNAAVAPGAPGIEPKWTPSTKNGLGTAYHTGCTLWFTLSHGIVNEIYYPTIDQPNTRDFQLLITDGETFCHEERRDLTREISYPERNCLLYRLTNTAPDGRYRIIKEICTDPHTPVLLVHTRLEVEDESLKGKLRLYALLAPHLERCGANNYAWTRDFAGRALLHAARENTHLSFGCAPDFTRRSVGFVGVSDGWQDLMNHFRMESQYGSAENGNVALTAELDSSVNEWTLAVAFGTSPQSAATALLQSLAATFKYSRDAYVRQWRRTELDEQFDFSAHTSDGGSMYRLSRCILLAHEDKIFQGAIIASLSIPWGEFKGDDDLGGYHLVWTRDLMLSASALLATGQGETPLRALVWLACIQKPDGSFPQNSWIDGRAYWQGVQLDEIAAPILVAWRLQREIAISNFDPLPTLAKATRYLLLQGPVTAQDRWEENSGYSPYTLAVVIAGLVCAADFASAETSQFILEYADWLAAHIEDWCVTSRGELLAGKPRHFVRITPADPITPDPHPDVDVLEIQLANGGGKHPARSIVGGDFLHLVRLGIRAADDPLVRDSIEVIDAALKRDLPQGPCWRRYNYDGYGQNDDGSAYNGTGVGRSWPILTGERGHYELAAGRDPRPFIHALEKMANEGGMLTEQLWDADDLPEARMFRGAPTGAAMPLCWSHAEYINLVRSARDGEVFGKIQPVYQRYVEQLTVSHYEMWTFRHQTRRISQGSNLRLLVAAQATVRWTFDNWQTAHNLDTNVTGLPDLYAVDLPTADLPARTIVEWTFHWVREDRWEGRNFHAEML